MKAGHFHLRIISGYPYIPTALFIFCTERKTGIDSILLNRDGCINSFDSFELLRRKTIGTCQAIGTNRQGGKIKLACPRIIDDIICYSIKRIALFKHLLLE